MCLRMDLIMRVMFFCFCCVHIQGNFQQLFFQVGNSLNNCNEPQLTCTMPHQTAQPSPAA